MEVVWAPPLQKMVSFSPFVGKVKHPSLNDDRHVHLQTSMAKHEGLVHISDGTRTYADHCVMSFAGL
jgi:hypothetical protein